MARIGAYDNATNSVVDAAEVITASDAYVITIDTGCDTSHPDLNCREVVDLVDISSSSMYGQDGNGHGTHVAGEDVEDLKQS
jgi:subtilisin family serine protease